MINYVVVEGSHKNPNEISTLDENTKKEYGPFSNEEEANDICKGLIQRNIDNYYHRAWVIKKD